MKRNETSDQSMKLLALDTSMQACSCALLVRENGEERLTARYVEIERGHAERLLPMIDEVLREAGSAIGEIDRFAVTRGPGAFTGVRIGISAARGFALACGKPLVGVGTLEVIAARALALQPVEQGELAVAIDARRGQVYFQSFDSQAKPLSPPTALAPEAAGARLAGRPVPLIGSGARLIAEAASLDPAAVCAHDELLPAAEDLARLAIELPASDEQPVSPLYLRPPDAKAQTGYAVERR